MMLPFLSDGFLIISVFTHVLLGGEGKLEVIEEFVTSVLWFFYY